MALFLLRKIKGEMQYMFKIKSKILKKLSAGFMAGLCAFSMLGSSMSGVITANAASTSTENSAFPSADTVVAKAATLLGAPYTFGNKGYWYAYNQGQYTPLSVETINNLGIYIVILPMVMKIFGITVHSGGLQDLMQERKMLKQRT